MERHPIVFISIMLVLGVLNGTTIALVIRAQQSIEQLNRSIQNMITTLAAVLDKK